VEARGAPVLDVRVFKPETDLAFQHQATGKRQTRCRACQAEYRRGHYQRNREAYLTRELARMRGYREENRIRLFEYVRAHACVDCGEDDPLLLEFDHRDPESKVAEVAWLANRKPWRAVLAEIEKCDVRCANCHRRRTAHQFAWPKLTRTRQREAELAAVALLDRPKLQSRSAMSWLELADTKKCTTCGVTKSIAEFALKDKASGRRSAKCRACQNEYSRDHYVRKREDHLRRARVRRKRDREICRHQAYEYLLTHPCVDCGETDPVVLDFDHRDRGLKRSTISRMLRQCSWAVVAAEIARCDVRCANCHRRRTAEQFGWFIAPKLAS